jgi:hypothetical protein
VRRIAAELRLREHVDIQIFADAHASLNDRPCRRFINLSADLKAPWLWDAVEPSAKACFNYAVFKSTRRILRAFYSETDF